VGGVPNRTSYELQPPAELSSFLFERPRDGAPKDDLVLPVEIGARLGQRLSLPSPREGVRERADADRQVERSGETATP